jgi:hypothetical protein
MLSVEPTTENKLYQSKPYHIYVTSNEEIKNYDWYYHTKTNLIYICNEDLDKINLERRLDMVKIVLTTDPDLIECGVQAIDNDFLKWFVKNPSCEEVETYSLYITDGVTSHHHKYQINICDEIFETAALIDKEEPKQETIEDVIMEYHQSSYENLIKELEKQDNFYEQLKNYYKTTPKEQVLEDWSESQEFDKIGPTMEEVIKPRRFFISYISKNNHFGDLSHGSFMYKNNKFPSKNQLIEDIKKDFIEIDSNYKIIITCISELSEEDYLNYIKE